jgi:hypothetical protein
MGFPLLPLQFSLVQPPKYHYHLSLYGGDLTLLPGVEAWLDSVINDCVIQCVATAALAVVYSLCTDHNADVGVTYLADAQF